MERADRHVFFSNTQENVMCFQGLQLKANVSLGSPRNGEKPEGNNDFLSSKSPSDSSQRAEPTSSQIFIWVWALKVLV